MWQTGASALPGEERSPTTLPRFDHCMSPDMEGSREEWYRRVDVASDTSRGHSRITPRAACGVPHLQHLQPECPQSIVDEA